MTTGDSPLQQLPDQDVILGLADVEGDLGMLQHYRLHPQAEPAREEGGHLLQGQGPQELHPDQVGESDLRSQNQCGAKGALAGAPRRCSRPAKGKVTM